MPTLIMRAVPPSETAASNGLNSVMRTLGSTVSATLVGVILASNAETVGAVEMPTQVAFQYVFAMGAGGVAHRRDPRAAHPAQAGKHRYREHPAAVAHQNGRIHGNAKCSSW